MRSSIFRSNIFSSLAMRLTLWYAASSFLIVLAATAILYWVLVATTEFTNGCSMQVAMS